MLIYYCETLIIVFFYPISFNEGSSIESSLKQFAERRTDIFGSGVEETVIGKKVSSFMLFSHISCDIEICVIID